MQPHIFAGDVAFDVGVSGRLGFSVHVNVKVSIGLLIWWLSTLAVLMQWV